MSVNDLTTPTIRLPVVPIRRRSRTFRNSSLPDITEDREFNSLENSTTSLVVSNKPTTSDLVTSQKPAPRTYTFTDVPDSARVKIYEMFLIAEHELIICPCDINPCKPAQQPVILRVCSTIRKEALPIYYRENRFMIRGCFDRISASPSWLKVLPQSTRDMITHVEISTKDFSNAVVMMCNIGFKLSRRMGGQNLSMQVYRANIHPTTFIFTSIVAGEKADKITTELVKHEERHAAQPVDDSASDDFTVGTSILRIEREAEEEVRDVHEGIDHNHPEKHIEDAGFDAVIEPKQKPTRACSKPPATNVSPWSTTIHQHAKCQPTNKTTTPPPPNRSQETTGDLHPAMYHQSKNDTMPSTVSTLLLRRGSGSFKRAHGPPNQSLDSTETHPMCRRSKGSLITWTATLNEMRPGANIFQQKLQCSPQLDPEI